MNKKLSIIAITLLVAVFSLVSYYVGSNSLKDEKQSKSNNCEYTQEEYDDIVEKIEYLDPAVTYTPIVVNEEAILNLEGECIIPALEKSYEYGIRSVRNLTVCWPDCMVTADYSPNRINFHIENNEMRDISIG